MAEYEDLEDLEEGTVGNQAQQGLRAELFGESDDEDEAALAPEEPVEELTTKQKLIELANRKRKEQDEEASSRQKKKRRRGGGSQQEAAGEDEQAAEAPDLADEDADEEGDDVPDEADTAFIDDEGVGQVEGPQLGSDSEEDAVLQPNQDDEAQEVDDEFERMFQGAKGRRRNPSQMEDVKAAVDGFLALMEVAAERDMEDNKRGKPALYKLKMLPEVEEKIGKRNWHDELMASGVLGVLKAWIEPLPDGNLPNIKIRTAVLRMLQLLPVDVADGLRREQLKKSEIGKVVMFLYKLPDESHGNKRLAKDLIERWSRPIFDQHRERREDEDLRERELQMRQARAARLHAQEAAAAENDGDGSRKPLKPGDPGFRYHASIPQPARLDYLKRPESAVNVDPASLRKGPGKLSGMGKKLKHLNAKKSNAGAKAAKVSVEGRGLLI